MQKICINMISTHIGRADEKRDSGKTRMIALGDDMNFFATDGSNWEGPRDFSWIDGLIVRHKNRVQADILDRWEKGYAVSRVSVIKILSGHFVTQVEYISFEHFEDPSKVGEESPIVVS